HHSSNLAGTLALCRGRGRLRIALGSSLLEPANMAEHCRHDCRFAHCDGRPLVPRTSVSAMSAGWCLARRWVNSGLRFSTRGLLVAMGLAAIYLATLGRCWLGFL